MSTALPPRPPVPGVVSRQAKAKAQREHARELLRDDRAQASVPTAQIASGKVKHSTWRDPSDLNPQRRSAKEISGFKNAYDQIERLLDNQTITRSQAAAARRLRKAYERSVLKQHGTVDWSRIPAGFAPGDGPSETTLQYLERYNRAISAMGRLGDIVRCVCLEEQTIQDYSQKWNINRSVAAGRLFSSLDCLCDHYDRIDGAAARRAAENDGPYLR